MKRIIVLALISIIQRHRRQHAIEPKHLDTGTRLSTCFLNQIYALIIYTIRDAPTEDVNYIRSLIPLVLIEILKFAIKDVLCKMAQNCAMLKKNQKKKIDPVTYIIRKKNAVNISKNVSRAIDDIQKEHIQPTFSFRK